MMSGSFVILNFVASASDISGNQDSRSIFLINRRDGTWNRPEIPPFSAELKLLGISVVVYAALLFLHPWFAGMPLIMHG